ncbi:ABC transporter substrate-binding protein [Spirosoma utsteinense]|uniref:Thiamine pyrimidine synthase n=1 Tax=Spirosoma utsteinense TaxID=2585773 RepID=A0ABR6W3X6_9BACT|nr:ABC transporter substrate-binding protein [Spirosoma utsteinense]MBC3787149.1 NitT/TauT family transport system substrate-binding protein [Spirosoma utsteinense]MBC3791301.1 NitT/TauT family transport system substrate-binding protein [Spirosoma utsteinense]
MSIPIRLALDWTPNTNHTGFYVALAKGLYKKAGLDIEIILPDKDNYQLTPAKRVASGQADLAITPSESIISFQTNGVPLVAVAAVLARDASAIVTLKQSGIDHPRQLDGKVYASYGARYEDEIVRQMIQNDGGRGQFVSHQPARLDIWQSLLTNEADATWIFLPWEGVEADIKGIELNQFLLDDYEIPYGYSPVLAAHRDWTDQNADALRQFMEAASAGFRFAVEDSDEAARLLIETAKHPTLKNRNFVEQSQQLASGYYLDGEGQWGFMHRNVWASFANWLTRNHLIADKEGELVQRIDPANLFTNEFLSEVPVLIR